MFFKKSESQNNLVFSDNVYKKKLIDNFKVDPVILISLIIAVITSIFLYSFEIKQSLDIADKKQKFWTLNTRINDFVNINKRMKDLTISDVNAENLIKIFSFMEKLKIDKYKIEFDSEKKVYFSSLIDIKPLLLDDIAKLNKESSVVNLSETNATLSITNNNTVNIKLIFY